MRKIRTVLLTAAIMMLAVCAGMGEEAVFQPKDLPVIYVQIDGGQAETEKMNSSPEPAFATEAGSGYHYIYKKPGH